MFLNLHVETLLDSALTLKGPGFWISAAERQKILKFGTYVE